MLHAYIAAARIREDRKGWLFRTSPCTTPPCCPTSHGSEGRLAHDPQACRRSRPVSRRRSATISFGLVFVTDLAGYAM